MKKIISLLLVCILVYPLLPVVAAAASERTVSIVKQNNLTVDSITYTAEEGGSEYDEDAVGTLKIHVEVTGPGDVKDVRIAIEGDSPFPDSKLQSKLEEIADHWKLTSTKVPDKKLPITNQYEIPVDEDDLGKTVYYCLAGVDELYDLVGYCEIKVDIPSALEPAEEPVAFDYTHAATGIGNDCTIAAGTWSSGFVSEDNVLYMTGRASDIPWHHEGNNTTNNGVPVWSTPVAVMDRVKSICFRNGVYAVIRTDGSLWMWGQADLVGNGGKYDREEGSNHYQDTPVKIIDNVASVYLANTTSMVAAVKTDGSLWMWGSKSSIPGGPNGELLPGYDKQLVPLKIMDGVRCASFSSSGGAIVKADGTLWTWGDVGFERTNVFTKRMDHVKAVSCYYHIAILKDDGSLWMAGKNTYGELGNGSRQTGSSAVYIAPFQVLDHVVAFTTQSGRTAAVTEDGSLYVWGNGSMCALGDGRLVAGGGTGKTSDEAYILSPTKILDDVVAVDLGRTGFALKTNGTVYGWGYNDWSCLGNDFGGNAIGSITAPGVSGTYAVQSTPTRVMTGIRTSSLDGRSMTPAAPAMDPNPSAWAKSIVEKTIGMKLVPDNLQGNYTKSITRAEFCALAATLYESRMGEVIDRKTFDDTKDANVEKMAALGVVAGVGNGKFAPDRNITREQAATMLAALAGVLGKPIEETDPAFADKGDISGWAVPFVGKMQASGIMNGTGNDRFSPQGSYTREQSIANMLSVLSYIED